MPLPEDRSHLRGHFSLKGIPLQTSPSTEERLPRPLLLLALSRIPRMLLDLATPAVAALLAREGFPPAPVIALGMLAAFAGYSAVYALNDLVDCGVDRETLALQPDVAPGLDLDSLLVRHPLARGLLNRREALLWTAGWAGLALFGAGLLNPVCPLIFLAASLVEILYCRLLKRSSLRGILSGIVKTSGPAAAVLAVAPAPSPLFLTGLILWLFCWEIGGQNIPNDLADLDGDRRIAARTFPLTFGRRTAIRVSGGMLALTVVLSLAMAAAPGIGGGGWAYPAGALGAGLCFLFLPWYRLHRQRDPGAALALFNRASGYPLALLLFTLLDKLR